MLAAHELHMPNCKCDLRGNLHNYDPSNACLFASNFLDNYANWDYLDPPEEIAENTEEDVIHLCCCSPELPHDESMKFMMLTHDDEVQNAKTFPNLDLGELCTQGIVNHRSPPVGYLSAVGRNILL